jgi:hypothetical protein
VLFALVGGVANRNLNDAAHRNAVAANGKHSDATTFSMAELDGVLLAGLSMAIWSQRTALQ